MSRPAVIAARQLAAILRGDRGLRSKLDALRTQEVGFEPVVEPEILEAAISADLSEKTSATLYPAFHVYCQKVKNRLTEKFRVFSGTAELAVDIRVTHDRAERLHEQLQLYVQAVTDVLDSHRGTWITGVFFTGGYEVEFQPVKRGGKNFIQSARVALELHISTD